MKDEIKEILEELREQYNTDSKLGKEIANEFGKYQLNYKELTLLLDYITNLEQENENRISESLSYDLAVARIKELEQKINGLQEERDYLYNKLSSENEHIHDYYKSRIDKAIEYCSLYTRLSAKELLNILQGGDK